MYESLCIYYFSGTGNALTASRWIEQYAKKKGMKTSLVPIDRLEKIVVPSSAGKRLIGFCYPTHGFNLPWIMLKFIFKFPRQKDCDVFLLNTRAGLKISSWFAPGISGIAQILPALILLIKGFRIRGMFPLDMPSNWISVHPGLNPPTVADIFAHCRGRVNDFCGKIFNGRAYFRPSVFFLLPLDIALAPIAFMYFMYGRFFFAKIFIASTDCDACNLCAAKCPTASIKMINKRPFWKFTCESCMRCINICPRKAIQVSHFLALFIIVISSLLPVALALELFNSFIPAPLIKPADFFVKWGISLSLFFLVSGLVFWLIKISLINKFFTATSLTKYWRRYIATGIKAKDY
jgi:Pyruvate/2-oxoacid:ferredoxin oxidoreductase delta subunit